LQEPSELVPALTSLCVSHGSIF